MTSDVFAPVTFRFVLGLVLCGLLAACGGRDDDTVWTQMPDPVRGSVTYFGDGRDVRALPLWERTLESRGRRVDVLWALSDALEKPAGTPAQRRLLWKRFLYLVDIGTTEGDLDAFLAKRSGGPAAIVVHYARAVRYVRHHDYAKALEIEPEGALDQAASAFAGLTDADTVRDLFRDQRALWQTAANAAPYGLDPLEGEFRYILIDLWSGSQGWKMPYLVLRGAWVPGIGTPIAGELPPAIFAQNLRDASAIAQAVRLSRLELDPVLDSPWLREQALYRIVALLYRQDRFHPADETKALHPLFDDGAAAPRADVHAWYVAQAGATLQALVSTFPSSGVAGDARSCLEQMREAASLGPPRR